jgi:hypothetical protein
MKALYLYPLAALGLCTAGVGAARAYPDVGKSQADLPNLQGEFAISNPTGMPIHYYVRWGNEPWKPITLRSGYTQWHWYPLDSNGRAPIPYVMFDGVANNHSRISRRMEFYAVGYPGYGPGPNLTQAKEYYFQYSPSGDSLELHAR